MDPMNTDYGDYVLCSMLIYIDFVRIFIYALIVFSSKHAEGNQIVGEILNLG